MSREVKVTFMITKSVSQTLVLNDDCDLSLEEVIQGLEDETISISAFSKYATIRHGSC